MATPPNKITSTYKANAHPESNIDPSPSKTSLLEKALPPITQGEGGGGKL